MNIHSHIHTNGPLDQRAVEPMGRRANGSSDLSDQRARRTKGPSDQRAVGPQGRRTKGFTKFGPLNQRAVRLVSHRINGTSDQRVFRLKT